MSRTPVTAGFELARAFAAQLGRTAGDRLANVAAERLEASNRAPSPPALASSRAGRLSWTFGLGVVVGGGITLLGSPRGRARISALAGHVRELGRATLRRREDDAPEKRQA